MNFKAQFVAIAVVMLQLSSCMSNRKTSISTTEGLSASASASNVALLLSSYGSTPSYGPQFENDLEQVRRVVSDPAGNFQFKSYVGRQAGHNQMLGYITSAAQQVDRDGTLLIFIAAHGAPNGAIQPADQAFATLGYDHILGAIKAGRAGQPFRRLVLIVSSCYSGAWLQTLRSSDGLFQERLVMTSVNAANLSNIAQASTRFNWAFQALKNNKAATLQDLVNTTRSYDPNVQFSAVPTSILSESLISTASTPTQGSEPTSPGTPKEPVDQPATTPPGTQTTGDLTATHLLTKVDQNGDLQLYVYVPVDATKVEIYSSAGWTEFNQQFVSQTGYPTIRGVTAVDSFATQSSAYVRVTATGKAPVVLQSRISHR